MLFESLFVGLASIRGVFGDTRAVQYSIVDAGVDTLLQPGRLHFMYVSVEEILVKTSP